MTTLVAALVKKLKQPIVTYFVKRMMLWRETETRTIPYYELLNIHVSNTRILANREDLLKLLPKDATVAEVGVDNGEFSKLIQSITRPKLLHLVDLWGSRRYGETKRQHVESLFADAISTGKVKINRGLSVEELQQFSDHYFDWVYIDTDHTYSTTAQELKICSDKVKKGGLILGHDYVKANWEGNMRYGVVEAVNEFCVNNKWELVYLTAETHQHHSFCIREIDHVLNQGNSQSGRRAASQNDPAMAT